MPGGEWRALGDYVRRARSESGLSHRAFAARLGISSRTLTNIERALRTSYRHDTVTGVEAGMLWQPGSWAAIVAGGEPDPVHDGVWEELRRIWPHLPMEARRLLLALAERSLRE